MSSLVCRASRTFLAAAAVAMLPPTVALASSRTVSDLELARASAAAVHGRVVAVESSWDTAADAIYTLVTLDVQQSWGLPGEPGRVVVKQLGGVVHDTALLVGGQAQFEVGEDVLLFLDVRPRDRTLSVAGLEQGKWTLSGSSGAATMTRDVHGTDPRHVVSRDQRSVADLYALAAQVGTRASAAGARVDGALGAVPAPGAAGDLLRPAFTLLAPGTPARWHEADTSTPVYVDTQAGGHPQFAGGGLTQLAQAAALWSGPGSLRLQPGVARSARCFTNSEPSDGRISVTYGDPCGEIADGSSTIAIGGAYFSSSVVRVVNGVSYWRMTKGMVVTDNPASKFSGMSTGCYADVLTHELGHVVGFGHAAARPAVMYPSIAPDCWSRSTALPLQADEHAGMAAVYPAAAGPAPPPGAPTGLGSTVNGSTVTITWSAPTGAAPTMYQLQAGSAQGLSNYGALNTAGTSVVAPNVPNGVYYVRVVAMNAAGVSAPTADHVVQVGPAPPGAPQNLTGSTAAGGVVSLSWLPPLSGGAPTSYVLLAGHTPGASSYQVPVSGTSVSGPGVPAAVYYVRIVAVNAAGMSVASNEVTLVVQ